MRVCSVTSVLMIVCVSLVFGGENLLKPKKSLNPLEFVCGTYRGMEREILPRFYDFQARTKNFTLLPTNDFIFDNVFVMEADSSIFVPMAVNSFDTDFQTFHFTPNGNGYSITSIPLNFDTVLGLDLGLGDDENTPVNLQFTFNFYGVAWTEVHVNSNAIIGFGGNAHEGGFPSSSFFNTIPKIAAYHVDLNPAVGGGVFQKSETNKITITWNNIPEFSAPTNSNTVQLVLYDDNSFDLTFNGIDAIIAAQGSPIPVGIHPGGTPSTLELISFSDDLPHSGAVGAAIYEQYLNVTTLQIIQQAVTQKFYQTFPDSFDQIIVFTDFAYDLGGGFAFHAGVSNSVQGIGRGMFDATLSHGSAGRLQSYISMNQLNVWPTNPEQRFFGDGNNFLTIMGQEAGHRWGAFLFFQSPVGQPSDLLLGRSLAHWSYYADLDHSSLEGGNWEHVSGDLFVVPTQVDYFSDIDEYTMGLRTPAEVSPTFYVSSPSNNTISARSQGTPLQGATATGTQVDVTINQIIAQEGPRIPAEANAQKDFREAFVLVIQNGTTPSQSDLNKIANFRRAWEDYFEISVDGRATMNTHLTTSWPVAIVRGNVLDASTSNPLEDVQVESVEREFSQFVSSGGRHVFRYMQSDSAVGTENVTIIASKFGFVPDTFATSISYGSTIVHDFQLDSLASATISGTITDSISGQGVVADVLFFLEGDPTGDPTYTTTTQPNGSYSVSAAIGNYRIEVLAPAPYVDEVVPKNVNLSAGGTTANFALLEAEVLLVDDDGGVSSEADYQSSLDRQNLRRRTFSVADSGSTPSAVLASFNEKPVMLWFTADDTTNALTMNERLVIVSHLIGGGNAIITGQNIAEFTAPGDTLLAKHLGIQYNGTPTAPFLRGFAGDIIGDGISLLFTASSKDMLSIITGSTGQPTKTLYYGTSLSDTVNIAGVRVIGPSSAWGATFFGFGLERLAPAFQDTFIIRSIRYFDQIVVSVSERDAQTVPNEFTLAQNYPNPFNPTTQIRYGLPHQSHATIIIYNVVGQEVAMLFDGVQAAGFHEVIWNGTNAKGTPVASGIYFYKLEATGENGTQFTNIKKMLMLK